MYNDGKLQKSNVVADKLFRILASNDYSNGDFIDFNIGDIVMKSKVFETAAWGMDVDTPPFLNQILGVKTAMTLAQIEKEIQEIDEYYGRQRFGEGYHNREMDVDVLYYKNEVHESPLIVPHGKIAERAFILHPLAEIAPDLKHPSTGLTSMEMLKKCTDSSAVKVL
jgi:2-amino-4-hydroxy-6-hydroxymethyldihydropteridine diphosphokinase